MQYEILSDFLCFFLSHVKCRFKKNKPRKKFLFLQGSLFCFLSKGETSNIFDFQKGILLITCIKTSVNFGIAGDEKRICVPRSSDNAKFARRRYLKYNHQHALEQSGQLAFDKLRMDLVAVTISRPGLRD